jgi:hypothetical protein
MRTNAFSQVEWGRRAAEPAGHKPEVEPGGRSEVAFFDYAAGGLG